MGNWFNRRLQNNNYMFLLFIIIVAPLLLC